MVSRNNAVFRFLLDIKDFVVKGRKVIQINNQITGSTTKASGSMDRLATSTRTTGQSMAANAVNFQTATQGMLNLSTAGVQTFTSFSNLDRAGNRLAMSQIGVSRATDLLNNKQLRLNELQAKGLGSSQKAVLLTNELKTARADLLVKTDKLKIEEGALFDIQLLFVTNIANVMISSLQTIVSLKNAHVGATIKQIFQERLLATTMFTKTIPAVTSMSGAMVVYNTTAKTVINTNRLLMIGIPVIGAVIVGASVAVQAYTENWGGFRDMIQTVLPFMRDQKELLGDVNAILGETTDSQNEFNKSLDIESKILVDLPKNLNLTADGLARINAQLTGSNFEQIKRYNFELSKTVETGQLFPSASFNGGFQQIGTQNKSNVITHEGDASSTAYGVPTNLAAFATTQMIGQFGYVPKQQPREYVNQAGNYVKVDLKGNEIVQNKPFITGQDKFTEILEGAVQETQHVLSVYASVGKKIIDHIIKPKEGLFQKGMRGLAEFSAQFQGFESAEQQKTVEQQIQELIDITPSTSLEKRNRFFLKTNVPQPGAGKFIGGRAISGATGIFFGMGIYEKLKVDLANKSSQLYQDYSPDEIKEFEQMVRDVETDPLKLLTVLRETDLLKQVDPRYYYGETATEDYNKYQAIQKDKADRKRLIEEALILERDNQLRELREAATSVGLSIPEFGRRKRLGEIGYTALTKPHFFVGGETFIDRRGSTPFTESQLKDLKQLGGIFRAGEQLFEPEKVKQARAVRERLEQGIFYGMNLPTDTMFDRLVKRSFGRTGGISLSPDDPLLKDISGFGENRAAVFNRRMIDPITGEDMGAFGVDIGRVADTISLQEAQRLGTLQKTLSGFRGAGGRTDELLSEISKSANAFRRMAMQNDIGSVSGGSIGAKTAFGRGFFKSTGATAAYQVPRGSIKTSAENRKRLDIRDRNANLLRFGGRLREGMTIEEEGAVVGGYSSVREFSAAARAQREIAWTTGKALAASFGQVMPSGYLSGQGWKSESSRLANAASEMKSALSSAGLSFKNVGYLDYGYRATASQAARAIAEHSAAVAYNNNQYAKATQINILEGGFDLRGFRGTTMDLPSLQERVAQEDQTMKSIGLSRTEAFQIVDTKGRGREEIDDRLKWKSRLNSISTGTAVL